MKITDNEKKVLAYLGSGWEGSYTENYYPFISIQNGTGLDRRHVRLACRSLARKGLSEYMRGLVSLDDGQMAGSGYGITKSGFEMIEKENLKIPFDEVF